MEFGVNRHKSVQSAKKRQRLIWHKHYNKGNKTSNRVHEVPSTAYDESNNNNVNIKNDGRTEEN